MPALGADMTEGTVVEWHVQPGDEVHRGDIVASVDTSKAEIDIEIFESGVIDELLVGVGEKVPVGTPLARLRGAAPVPAPAPSAAPAPAPPPPAPVPVGASAGADGRLRVTPVARRMAQQLGVDLATAGHTGPHGSVCKADVERAAAAAVSPPPEAPAPAAPAPAAPAPSGVPSMREAIAQLMARSKRDVPHYYLATDIDLAAAVAWTAEHNAGRAIAERIVVSALLLAATARAAARFDDLNGFWIDGAFRPATGVHLGVAISLREGGLVAPAIHDADRRSAAELMGALRDLVRRARSGRLRGSEMADPTLTVTNLGDHGADLVHGVIYPPQVALVGFGAVRERPWAVDGMLAVRPVVTATLAADHRQSDGHRGALLLSEIDHLLQEPEKL
jgi:pyruvate dehydrogenase E2 component (dihydrolipoamide acetyltransferase)